MKCLNCNKNISDDSIYCTHCGKLTTKDNNYKQNTKNTFKKIIKENSKQCISNTNFFTGKNIVIIILSILLFCSIIGQPNTTDLDNTITNLNSTIIKLKEEVSSNEEHIKKIYNENTDLKSEIENLKNENESLKSENEKLNTKSQNYNANSNTTTTTSNSNNNQSLAQINNSTEMVWVGNTGTKYHIESCRTLKGNGHQITYEQAISQGREACKVCH